MSVTYSLNFKKYIAKKKSSKTVDIKEAKTKHIKQFIKTFEQYYSDAPIFTKNY